MTKKGAKVDGRNSSERVQADRLPTVAAKKYNETVGRRYIGARGMRRASTIVKQMARPACGERRGRVDV